jgi:hypothetical protein
MPTLLIILAIFGCVIIYFIVQAAVTMRRLNRLPPTPPRHCPQCNGTEYKSGVAGLGVAGVWDGLRDPETGTRPHGTLFYGTCERCGSRVAQWDDGAPYVPSDEEWRREVGPMDSGGLASGG